MTAATAYFASDFHLDRTDPEGVARACRFVDHACEQGADALYLLGDVFKAWCGPASLRDPGLRPFLDRLARAVREGVHVATVHGNHDFLMDAALDRELGVVVSEHIEVNLDGRRTLLTHGDEFCTLDVGHQRAHAVLRSKPVLWLLRTLPGSWTESIWRGLIFGSKQATSTKRMEIMDIVDDEVVDTLDTGVDLIVCGHVHHARDARFELSDGRHGRLVVMADFEASGSHAVYRDGQLDLVSRDRRFERPVITLDGPAGSGKSSVSRGVARRLGFAHLDSGSLYRAVTREALRRDVPLTEGPLSALAGSLSVSLGADGQVLVDGAVVPDAEFRTPEVSAHVSVVSAVPAVRKALLELQRGVAAGPRGVVAEGRDMGTVVFPDAAFHIWLDARPEVRAARRLAQNRGEGADLAQVQTAIEARDRRDSSRTVAPLMPADGSIRLETSDLTRDEVVERVVGLVLAGPRPEADSRV